MNWTAEILDDQEFWRATTARYDETLALVVGPTADGRWQARCGSWRSSTREIAETGSFLTTEKTVEKAKAIAVGWATGV